MKSATAYVTALGMVEARLNGRPIGDQALAPQYTPYNQRLLYQTYDVTDLLQKGPNAFGVLLADGWYRLRICGGGRKGYPGSWFGDSIPRLLLQVEIELQDGSHLTLTTDNTWKCTLNGPLIQAILYDGEYYDARKELPGWDGPSFDDTAWNHAVENKPYWLNDLHWIRHDPAPINIGRSQDGYYFQGIIDDVRIGSQPDPASPNLLAHWPMDENQGDTAADAINKLPASIHGPAWTTGRQHAALQFNGTSDYVDCGNPDQLNLTSQLFVSASVKPLALNRYQRVLSKGEHNTAGWLLGITQDNRVDFTVVNAIGRSITCYGTTPLALNTWYNIAAALDNQGNLKVYLNGQLENTVPLASAAHLTLSAQMNQPVRTIKEIQPVAVTEPQPGILVYDMGQIIAGHCRIVVEGPAGAILKLHHVEGLHTDGSGMIYTHNIQNNEAEDTYILKGTGRETYEPRFTYHGFRYVEVTAAPHKPTIRSLVGVAQASDTPQTGYFSCSDPNLNQLWQNVYWTYRGNMQSVVTDCAGRDERMGWMGDSQASFQSICYCMDAAAFGANWVHAMWDEQSINGMMFPITVPAQGWGPDYGPAWSDAGVIIPWTLYLNYADRRLLENAFEPARRYVDAIAAVNPNHLWYNNRGMDFNDWLCSPGCTLRADIFSTAFYAHSTRLVQKMAAKLGRTTEEAHYAELFNNIKAAFNKGFVNPDDGTILGNQQGAYALALMFDLLDEPQKTQALNHLASDVTQRDDHLSTGIHTTKYMLKALSEMGQHDLAFRAVNNPTPPSYRYMVDCGATTIWERYNSFSQDTGYLKDHMNDLDHTGLSSIGQWLWQQIVGLTPDEEHPGYKHFIIPPANSNGSRPNSTAPTAPSPSAPTTPPTPSASKPPSPPTPPPPSTSPLPTSPPSPSRRPLPIRPQVSASCDWTKA